MGSSIRSYLWLCCGVFHQIPTLAILTSLGEEYKGSEGPMLCLHLSCLFLLPAPLPVYLFCVVADCHRNACLFTVCVLVVHLYISVLIQTSYFTFCFNLCIFLHVHVSYLHCTPSPLHGLCMFIHMYIHAHVPCDSVCACDCLRPCGRCSERWPVDTEP